MKKTYIIPTTDIVKVETMGMIATSDFDSSLGVTGVSGEDALSRDSELWDEF